MKYLLGFLTFISICFADSTLDKLENTFVSRAEQIATNKSKVEKAIDDKYAEYYKRLDKVYVAGLKRVYKEEKDKGNLDGLIEVKKCLEIAEKAIAGDKPIEINGAKTKVESLNKLKLSYGQKKAKLASQKVDEKTESLYNFNRQSQNLTTGYIKTLKKLMSDRTKKGDIDNALLVKAKITEIEKIRNGQLTKPELTKPELTKPELTKPTSSSGNSDNIEKALAYKLKRHPIEAKQGPNGHYYLYVEKLIKWEDAYNAAKNAGGYLAVITTQEEYDFLAKLANITDKSPVYAQNSVWLGGRMSKGKISWITNEPQNKEIKHKEIVKTEPYRPRNDPKSDSA